MKILLIDIETSPLTAHCWGLFDQNISINQVLESSYTLCYSAKWYGNPKIMFDSIHKTSKDTEGCILLGTDWKGGDFVSNSKSAFNTFFNKLKVAKTATLFVC